MAFRLTEIPQLPEDPKEGVKMVYVATLEHLTMLDVVNRSLFQVSYKPPVRPRVPDIAFADGTHWNPTGAGPGFYYFGSDGVWHPMGGGAAGPAGPVGPQGPPGPQGPAGLQTPWLSNIDGAGFDLTNVKTINYQGGLIKAATGTVTTLQFQDPIPNHTFSIQVNATQTLLRDNAGDIDISANTNSGRVNQLYLNWAGNVGIGTASPGQLLTVAGNANITNTLVLGTAPYTCILYRDGATGFLSLDGLQDVYSGFYFRTTSGGGLATRMTVTNAGNVGVGTTGPSLRLSVMGGYSDPVLGAARGTFGVFPSEPGWGMLLSGRADGTGWIQTQRTDGNATTYPLSLNPIGGHVYVGYYTDNVPIARLHVMGGVHARQQDATLHAILGVDPGVVPTTGESAIGMYYDLPNNCGHIEAVTAYVAWRNIVTNINGGNFGIGVAAPASKLTVAGNVEVMGGATVVFRPPNNSYDLGIRAVQTPDFHLQIGSASFATIGIWMHYNGSVGLGVNPGYRLHLVSDGAAKPTTSTWTVTSDARTKRSVRDLEGGLEVIAKLRPIEAEHNGLGGTPEGERVVGFLAQEIREILPGTVGSKSRKLRAEDLEDTDVLDFNIHEVLMHLVLAVKQLASKETQR